jgi:DNA-binding transcriptional LysR family regulator
MNTESVRLFILAAEKLNISSAGRELGFAPAVASSRLAKLEKTMGAELLHRSTRKVTLSLEGAEFLPYAKEMLAQKDAALAALGLGNPIVTGKLRFAAPSTFAQLYIAPILPKFLKLHPGINLDLKLSDTQMDLFDGGFDLALRNMAVEDSSLKARKLADDTRILCASPAYTADHGAPQHPNDLKKHQVMTFNGEAVKRFIDRDGEIGEFDPKLSGTRLTFDDGLSQKIATIAGAGISENSVWSVHQELKNGTLQRILPEYVVHDETALWLVYPKSNVLTAKVRVFIDFLVEEVGSILSSINSSTNAR